MVNILKGVVERGSGRRIGELGIPLAGKTGTSNDSRDAWFIGFTPDLAVGVFAGFDMPTPMGERESGASVAAPIFKAFMGEAFEDRPHLPFRVADGIRQVRVNARTGQPAGPGETGVIREAFKAETRTAERARAVLDKVVAISRGGR